LNSIFFALQVRNIFEGTKNCRNNRNAYASSYVRVYSLEGLFLLLWFSKRIC
jgi:hypothetical protein